MNHESMWKKTIISIVLGLCLLVISCSSSVKISLDKDAKARLSEIPGTIGIEFGYADAKKCWRYSITKGEMILEKTWECPPGWISKEPNYVQFKDEIPKELPGSDGYNYNGPYGLSPDKSLMLISIAPIDYEETVHTYSDEVDRASGKEPPVRKTHIDMPLGFALIQWSTKTVISQRKTDYKKWPIGISYSNVSASWSPDSLFFAILERKSKISHILSAVFFYSHGPVTEDTYYLYVYNREGALMVKSEVASGFYGGAGRVFWEVR